MNSACRLAALLTTFVLTWMVWVPPLAAQEQSLKPGINRSYVRPDAEKTARQFERESREVVKHLDAILAACELKAGMVAADVGAGTGLYTRPFARAVGPRGRVFAVDISDELIAYIKKTCRQQGIDNVTCVQNNDTAVCLPAESVDLVFVCDTYHHFEYPFRMLDSIFKALKPGGRMVVVDYERQPGVSADWILGHVRAGKKTVVEECRKAGFTFLDEVPIPMKENYVIRLQKPSPEK